MMKESLALSICETLSRAGHVAYFAGGYVRDKLLHLHSEDIDIATDASPEKILSLFDKTVPLGISFGIVVVVLKNHSFEVATFRKDIRYIDGRRPKEVAFSSPEEDAERRDFTINGMFYDPIKKEIYDYIGGKEDLRNKLIRAIGNPESRFEEDRLRMIRAARCAARFTFDIEEKTKQAIPPKANTLFPSVSMERIYHEFKKMSDFHFDRALELLRELRLLPAIFPSLQSLTKEELLSRTASFRFLPKDCPMILKLLELFPEESLEEKIAVAERLKVSGEEIKWIVLRERAERLYKEKTPKKELVRFYAEKNAWSCLEIVSARLPGKKRTTFLTEHRIQYASLEKHVDRRKERKYLVSSEHLKKYGAVPGKRFGELLEKAEEIAIEENRESPEEVIHKLRELKYL